MQTSYTPVQWVYREVIEEELAKRTEGKVFFFNTDGAVSSVEGKIVAFEEISGKGLFIRLEPLIEIRVDRIITLFGKPGAAYDEYDAFGNACMDCKGGYDFDLVWLGCEHNHSLFFIMADCLSQFVYCRTLRF